MYRAEQSQRTLAELGLLLARSVVAKMSLLTVALYASLDATRWIDGRMFLIKLVRRRLNEISWPGHIRRYPAIL